MKTADSGIRGVGADMTEQKRAEARAEQNMRTIETLNHIMTAGNRATSVRSFAQTLTDLTIDLLNFDVGTIHLVDYDARLATLCYARGVPDCAADALRALPIDDTTYACAVSIGAPIFADGSTASRVPHAANLGVESLAVVPLCRYDKRIGALSVGSFKHRTFSQAEKELLVAIGNEAGAIIAKLEADEALKENERRIRQITNSLPVVVYEADATGRVTFANAVVSDLFGYTKEDFEAGLSVYQLIVPADQKRARAIFHQRVSGKDVGRMECTGLRKDGSRFNIAVRFKPIKNGSFVIGAVSLLTLPSENTLRLTDTHRRCRCSHYRSTS